MLTHVMEGPDLVVIRADDQERFFADIRGHEVTGLRQFLLAASDLPDARPETLPLKFRKVAIQVRRLRNPVLAYWRLGGYLCCPNNHRMLPGAPRASFMLRVSALY